MNKTKKSITIFLLTVILISLFQNITFAVTEINSAKLIKGATIKTNIKFDDGITPAFELQANYIYYLKDGKQYPAYCVVQRSRRS